MTTPTSRSELTQLIDATLDRWVKGKVEQASPGEVILSVLTDMNLAVVPLEASAEMADAAGEALKKSKIFGGGPHASIQVAIACVGFTAMLEAGRLDRPKP